MADRETGRNASRHGPRFARQPTGATLTVVGVVLVGLLATTGFALFRSPKPASRRATPPAARAVSANPPGGSAAAVRLVAMFPVQSNLMAAADGRLYAIEIRATGGTFVRVDPDGRITRRSIEDPLAPYFSAVSAQGGSVFVGTAVVPRFTSAKNELLRLDASTLAVAARRRLPGGVIAIASDPRGVWVALTDERVLRLDPTSLAMRASFAVPRGAHTSSAFGSLSLGPGGLWTTFGTARHTTADRFDPATLSLLDRIRVRETGQGIRVVASPASIWLVGTDFARRMEPSGVALPPVPVPALQGAAVSGTNLLVVHSAGATSEELDVLDERGDVVARSLVGDAGSVIVPSGRDVWLERGLRIARWRLIAPGR
jgi:hypothetical protein